MDDYGKEVLCAYKDETYSVRDNGAILRHSKEGGRKRNIDNTWTFGKINSQKGYLEIASVQIHRIVATTFHGEPPTRQHVVDHIDTNRQNNRPENLRWVTRFENILLNEITRKKIELLCGCSVEEVLANLSILHKAQLPAQFSWMKTVTAEEAEKSLVRWKNWASNPKSSNVGMPLWEDNIRKSKTYGAAQKDWHQAGIFPCCPVNEEKKSLQEYQNNLISDAVFYKREKEIITVVESAMNETTQTLCVKCHRTRSPKHHCLITVTFQNDWFIHSITVYFAEESLEKYFAIAQGNEWTGGPVFDDQC